MKCFNPRRKHAFTLLEVMVSLFLLAFVIAAVYSSWNAVVRGSQVGLKAAAEVQRSRIAMRTLEDSLTSVRMFLADPELYAFYGVNGSKAQLSFVAKLPDWFPRGGKFGDFTVRRVSFELESGQGGSSQLVLRQIPLLMEIDEDEQEHPVILAKNVEKFEMEFWDTREGDWIDEWTQTNQLPAMVKVSLQFDRAGVSKNNDEVTRVVALPAVAVAPIWQTQAQPGTPPLNQPPMAPPLPPPGQ